MEVIDISSSDSEDCICEDETEHPTQAIDRFLPLIEDQSKRSNPASQPTVNPDSGSSVHLHDTGDVTWEDDASPLAEHTYKHSPLKECSLAQKIASSNVRTHNKSILTSSGQKMCSGSGSGQKFDDTAQGMWNRELEPSTGQGYERSITPFKQTMQPENGPKQNAGHNHDFMLKGDMKHRQEHIRTILPHSFLVSSQSNGNTLQGREKPSNDYEVMASQQTMNANGNSHVKYGEYHPNASEHEAKPTVDNKQKRILPSSFRPTTSKTVSKVSDEILMLDYHENLGSSGEAKVTYPKHLINDTIDRRNDHNKAYESAGAFRQLPAWMNGGSATGNIDRKNDCIQAYGNAGPLRQLSPYTSGGSATGKFAVSSATTSLSGYSDSAGNQSGIKERSMEPDERLIFQAALQDLAQPKYVIDLPCGLLTVPLLRHQRIALSWMHKKEASSHCSGGILADDQGLGKTISTIALIQMEMPHQVDFSSSLSGYVKSDVLNLDEADHVVLDDKKRSHFEEDLGSRPQNYNRPSNHSSHTTSEVLSLEEIDEQRCGLDMNFGEDIKTNVKSETSDLVKLDLPLPKMKQNNHTRESSSSKVRSKKNTKSTTQKERPAGGTLIVCPAGILRQWAQELDEKVPEDKKLKVLVYHGSSRSKDPSFLAKYDVVLTTYTIVTNEVPKQPLSVQKDLEDFALSSEFSLQNKRKKTSDVHERGKKQKKGVCDSGDDYGKGPLARVRWFRVVLDEAQSIKNYRTQVSRACCGLRAKRRWCLSGTPLQNSLDDLYSYFRFLKYDPYASYSYFCSSIKNLITKNASMGYQKLQAVLRTIMLRRTKGTLIDGEPIIKLPPRLVHLKKIDFSLVEKEFYSNLEADSRQKFKAYDAAGTVNQNYASILVLLLRLRQACDHPLLVKEYHSGPVATSSLKVAQQLPRDMLMNLSNRLEASLAICGICSDPPEDAAVAMCGHVFCYQCISVYLTGDDNVCPAPGCKDNIGPDTVFSRAILRNCLAVEQVEDSSAVAKCHEPGFRPSSKITATMDILKSIFKDHFPEASGEQCDEKIHSAHGNSMSSSETNTHSNAETSESITSHVPPELPVKAIVFSQWTSMLDFLEISLNLSLIQYRRLDGTMSLASRDRAVKDFNTDPEVTVMIMSLKAGNLGLNMIAACHVILLDPWWNPTTEDQAIDRAHRIGQTRPVTVFRLTVNNTVEDRILTLQEKKREMVASAFGEDQTFSRVTRLTAEDLRFLFEV